jgi:hypothetical protein
MPVGAQVGDCREQLNVHALVDHAEETEPRMRNCSLIGQIVHLAARGCEMRGIHAARKHVHARVLLALRLI